MSTKQWQSYIQTCCTTRQCVIFTNMSTKQWQHYNQMCCTTHQCVIFTNMSTKRWQCYSQTCWIAHQCVIFTTCQSKSDNAIDRHTAQLTHQIVALLLGFWQLLVLEGLGVNELVIPLPLLPRFGWQVPCPILELHPGWLILAAHLLQAQFLSDKATRQWTDARW